MSLEDEVYDAEPKVLGACVDHDAQEEEGKMFPQRRGSGMDRAGLA
jgi:hypothetical protein